MGQGGARGPREGPRGHQRPPGGTRLLPPPKRVIKQQHNGSKPCYKVPKVFPVGCSSMTKSSQIGPLMKYMLCSVSVSDFSIITICCIKTSTIKSEKNICQKIHSTSFIFIFFGNFYYFFVFFPIFYKKMYFF